MAGDPGDAGLPLLGTKLHPPRHRPSVVSRPRLADHVDRGRHAALTLVSAPAGFGKTTLVSEWLAGDAATAWLSLDAHDDDPTRFWTYVLAALRTVVPGLSPAADDLLRAPGAPADAVVATLINDLAAADADVTLVLDDYHLVESAEVHGAVAFLLDHLPAGVRLVIATRSDPPFPLASMRARGDLAEIRAAALRFTADEATEYLTGSMGLALDAADVAALDARTEGWIAALQLAALSMQGRDDPAAFVAAFAGDDRFILDYLADEVLERQSPAVRDFLLDTSVLARLTGSLCAAVTGDPDARGTLEVLDRSNLFLVPLDDRRTWYRYHHLFGDVLRARLLDERGERVTDLHRRAGEWWVTNGDLAEAIRHARSAGDPAWTAELLERAAPAMSRARQEAQLRAWLEELPDELFADRPVLTMTLIGTRMSTGDPTGVEPLLASAEAWLDRDDTPIVFDTDEYRRLPALAGMYRAALALLAGDADGATAHATRVLDLATDADPLQRGAGAALLGLAHWARGDLDPARERYAESVDCFERAGFLPDVMGCSLALADIQLAQGRLNAAQDTFESALRHTVEHPGLRGAADMHVGLAGIAIERDDLDEAQRRLRASADLGDHMGLPQHPYRRRVAEARLARARGDLDGALRLLIEAEAVYETDFSPSVRPVSAMRALVQVELGDLAAGERWAADHQLRADDELTYVREFEHLALARVLVARGVAQGDRPAVDRAVDLLRRLLAAADEGGREGSALEVLVALSLALRAAGDDAGAAEALDDAHRRAELEGYVRLFVDAGSAVPRPPSPATSAPRLAGPDELSERELDVLRLLRSDLSGPDIARELIVSLNTFRTHTKHIYTKLGVNNRREAVTRAAELGLL